MRFLTVLFMAMWLNSAHAQIVIQADLAMVQPTVSRDAGGFSACGVRVVTTIIAGTTATLHDFSVNAYGKGFGLIKAGAYKNELPVHAGKEAKLVLPAPVGFWIAATEQPIATRPSKIYPADSQGFILGNLTFDEAFNRVFDIAHGKKIQVAIVDKSDKVDRAISFSVEMKPDDLAALKGCANGMLDRMSAEFERAKVETK